MKVSEILYEQVKTNSGSLRFSQTEIDKAVQDIQHSPVFKELNQLVKFASTPRMLKNGTLQFSQVIDPSIPAKHVRTPVNVNAKGYVRGTSGSKQTLITGNEVELDPQDLVKSYEVMLTKLVNYVRGAKDREALAEKSRKKTSDIKTELIALYQSVDRMGLFKDEASIKKWFSLNGVTKKHYKIHPDLSVDTIGDVNVSYGIGHDYHQFDRCPVNFKHAGGNFLMRNRALKTLQGLPQTCDLDLSFSNNEIKTLDLPFKAKGIDISYNPITSLHDVHKFIKADHILIYDLSSLRSSVLGLLYFDKVTYNSWRTPSFNWEKALIIVKRHMSSSDPVNKKIINCQSELLDSDLDEFAKL